MFEFVMTENEGICIFGLSKFSSFNPSRRTITGWRWTHGAWDHHLCYPGCNVRYSPLFNRFVCNSSDTWSNLGLVYITLVDDYLHCLERGRAATAKMSAFLRKSLQPQLPIDSSKAGWFHMLLTVTSLYS